LPPDHSADEATELHQQRSVATSFGSDTERYDRTRSRCPEAVLDRLLRASPGRNVLDVGCGTGILTRQLRDAGCRVLGVEPDQRMAEYARKSGLEIDVATFEDWDASGRTFDLVTASVAWHWIDPVAGAVTAAKALRPGGLLAPLWHTYELPAAVTDAYGAALHRVAPGSPFERWLSGERAQAYVELFDRVTDGIRRSGLFLEPERWQADWEVTYTRDEWLDRMPTQGGALAGLSAGQRSEVLRQVGGAIDADGGCFTLEYSTVVISARSR
jgi:SAM-dependent methyltransferase